MPLTAPPTPAPPPAESPSRMAAHAEKPAEKPVEQVAETPAEKPPEKRWSPPEKPADKPVDRGGGRGYMQITADMMVNPWTGAWLTSDDRSMGYISGPATGARPPPLQLRSWSPMRNPPHRKPPLRLSLRRHRLR